MRCVGSQTQLSHRYASDRRNAAENCEVRRPLSICGAKNVAILRTLGVDRLDAAVLTSVFNEHSFVPLDVENQGQTTDLSLGAIKRRLTHLGTCGA